MTWLILIQITLCILLGFVAGVGTVLAIFSEHYRLTITWRKIILERKTDEQ